MSREERYSCFIIRYTFIMLIYFILIAHAHFLGSSGTTNGGMDLVLDIEIKKDVNPSHDLSSHLEDRQCLRP